MRLIPGYLYCACSTYYPSFCTVRSLCKTPIPHPKQGGSLYDFMIVFNMTRPGRDLKNIRIRCGHANHSAIPTQHVYDAMLIKSFVKKTTFLKDIPFIYLFSETIQAPSLKSTYWSLLCINISISPYRTQIMDIPSRFAGISMSTASCSCNVIKYE